MVIRSVVMTTDVVGRHFLCDTIIKCSLHMIFIFIQSDKFSSLKHLRMVAKGDTNDSVFPLLAVAAHR